MLLTRLTFVIVVVSLTWKAIKLLIISSTNINLLKDAELLLAPRTIFPLPLSRWRMFSCEFTLDP